MQKRFAKNISFTATATACSLLLSISAAAAEVRFEPYVLNTFDGKDHDAERGRLTVIENRSAKTRRPIEIAFVPLRSTSTTPGSPIVCLAGGPGVPRTGMGLVHDFLKGNDVCGRTIRFELPQLAPHQ